MTLTAPRRYRFVSQWQIPAETHRCWQALCAVDGWSAWWPGVREAQLFAATGAIAPGTRARVVVGSPLGFRLDLLLTLTSVSAPHAAQLAVSGDLSGTGTWRAVPEAAGTQMTFEWAVSSRRFAVNACSPLAGWAHRHVMAAGERGLEAHLSPGTRSGGC